MKRLLFVLFAAALVVPAAFAKGPSEASISGPGLGKTITLAGMSDASDLTQNTGYFPAVFGQSPDPMLPGKPAGRLGAKFTIRYVVPGGNSTSFRLTQELYPYAAGGALTYMKPGQAIFGATTNGGWYRGGDALERTLARAGFPVTAPPAASDGWGPFPTWLLVVVGVMALIVAAALAVRRIRVAAPA
jgi:hypothetical protein